MLILLLTTFFIRGNNIEVWYQIISLLFKEMSGV